LPEMIERVFTTADSISEPHKFTSALMCMSSVVATLVAGKHDGENIKTQIIPLLFSVLPGIDSNDIKKTTVTMQFLTSICILIPFVDCSKAFFHYENLSEEESLICEQTSQLEDFILQYLDRIFIVIENSGSENIRMDHVSLEDNKSKLESIVELFIQNSTHAILSQCSDEILNSASKKMIDYIKNNALEPHVAGTAISSLCRVFARINGKKLYSELIPHLIEIINNHFDDDVHDIEKQNDDFLYYVTILSSILKGDPIEIQSYIDDLILVIDKLLKCKCKNTKKIAVSMITNLLIILSVMQTNDVKTTPAAFNEPLQNFLPIRHWCNRMKKNEKFEWFVPGENERKLCEKIIHYYLRPIIGKFNKFIDGEESMSKDDILLNLQLINGIIKCNNFLPKLKGESINFIVSSTKIEPFELNLGFNNLEINMPDGSNVRCALVDLLSKLQEKLLRDCEDDINSLKQLLDVWDRLCLRLHSNSLNYESQMKNYQFLKQYQEYKLCKSRRDIRAVVATRVIIQQDLRDEIFLSAFTIHHKKVMENFLKLSTSRYATIRSIAQSKMFKMFVIFPFSYKCILDDILSFLNLNPVEHHEAFKGALFLIGSNRRNRLMLRPDWESIKKIWLAFIKTKLSEKLSVLRLIDSIADGINNEFQTITTELFIDDDVANFGANLVNDKSVLPSNYLEVGKKQLAELSAQNKNHYHSLIDEILEYSHQNTLHWRYQLICSTFINILMHPVSKYTPNVTHKFVANLIHDSIEERNLALKICKTILSQQKREHIKVQIDPLKDSKDATIRVLSPGLRDDNQWMQYDVKKVPQNQTEWDEPKYLYKNNGFFGWTPIVSAYAPYAAQPKLDRAYDELSEHEKYFYDFFNDSESMRKLVEFWSMEEKKGKEHFHRSRFWLIKQIFNVFGDVFLDNFINYINLLLTNERKESSHRCAAEFIAGILRGAKHWPYEKTRIMYEKLLPVIKLALDNISTESQVIWGCAFATSVETMDPYKQFYLHEALLENPINSINSFNDCSRLYCLQGIFNQHSWRMRSVAFRLNDYLDSSLNHPFQNVRERVSSTLINIYEGDLNFINCKSKNFSPQITELFERKKQDLSLIGDIGNCFNFKMKRLSNYHFIVSATEPGSPTESAVRLFKSLAQFISGLLNRCTNGNEPIYFEFLSIGVGLEKSEYDVELAEICSVMSALISQALTKPEYMTHCLSKIEEISYNKKWSVRLSIVDILQVFVFHNMTIVLSKLEWIERVESIVLRLLEDTVLEVRVKAAQVLGGLIHCSFLPQYERLIAIFKKKCKAKMHRGGEENGTRTNEYIRNRHSGILGLCAFITAFPYTVPDFVPNIFEFISNHLNDPQPIPVRVNNI
jgi:proteasome activator subunit 4